MTELEEAVTRLIEAEAGDWQHDLGSHLYLTQCQELAVAAALREVLRNGGGRYEVSSPHAYLMNRS